MNRAVTNHLFGFVASVLVAQIGTAQVDHSPTWVSATSLTYHLTDLDHFAKGSYGACDWGNFMDDNTFFAVDLTFKKLTSAPYSNANTDLFVTWSGAGYLQRQLFNQAPFPADAVWTAPTASARGQVLFNFSPNVLELYRYLHFRNELRDEISQAPVPADAEKIIVLIHGWNPSSRSDSYSTAETAEFSHLVANLRTALAGSDWKLVLYHWEADADTGPIDSSLYRNPTEAAEISHRHGQHLGELLTQSFPNLHSLQLIAHSAGAWTARSAARYVLANNSFAIAQVTLLDPFMPTALFPAPDTVLGDPVMNGLAAISENNRLTLENYFADELTFGTQEVFAWRPSDLNRQVDWDTSTTTFYRSHEGPIQFYADTVRASLAGQVAPAGLGNFDVRPTSDGHVGWTRSLFCNEPVFAPTGQPQNQTLVPGSSIVLNVAAATRNLSSTNFGYQWFKNHTVIPGATASTLVVPNAQSTDSGTYVAFVINGSGITLSSAAAVTVRASDSRLTNLSVRSTAGSDNATLIVGFVTEGGESKQILLRGVGPTLADYGVQGTLDDPQLRLFDVASAEIAQNDDWGGAAPLSAAFAQVGAFSLLSSSKDAALLKILPPGVYSAHITTATPATGIALVEAYDSDPPSGVGRLINLSARTRVGTSDNILIAGFVVSGTAPLALLIRGAGPTLGNYGVTGVLNDPKLEIYRSSGPTSTLIATNDNWGGDASLQTTFTKTGAFNFTSTDSKDAAILLTVEPGVYTAQVSGVNNDTGVALVEVYVVQD